MGFLAAAGASLKTVNDWVLVNETLSKSAAAANDMDNSQVTVLVQVILQYIANIASKINTFQLLKCHVIENHSALQLVTMC